jgi:hypothetical protein
MLRTVSRSRAFQDGPPFADAEDQWQLEIRQGCGVRLDQTVATGDAMTDPRLFELEKKLLELRLFMTTFKHIAPLRMMLIEADDLLTQVINDMEKKR